MEITKVAKPFIRRGANTFGNIVYMNTSGLIRPSLILTLLSTLSAINTGFPRVLKKSYIYSCV